MEFTDIAYFQLGEWCASLTSTLPYAIVSYRLFVLSLVLQDYFPTARPCLTTVVYCSHCLPTNGPIWASRWSFYEVDPNCCLLPCGKTPMPPQQQHIVSVCVTAVSVSL